MNQFFPASTLKSRTTDRYGVDPVAKPGDVEREIEVSHDPGEGRPDNLLVKLVRCSPMGERELQTLKGAKTPAHSLRRLEVRRCPA